jgi:four helix bundle protein
MAINKFEDLVAWQKARVLTKSIYLATRKEGFAKDFGLSGQIQRASVSIMSNVAEGFDRSNPAEFHQFLVIAKGSCAEVRSQLYVAVDIGYLTQIEFDALFNQAQELARVLGGLRASVERQRTPKR